jgi:hypothetical protein
MKTVNKIVKMIILVIFVLTFGFLTGCATNRIDLVDSGVLTLEKQATGKVYIAWSDAYEDGDGFVVTGVLRRRDTVGLPIKAHVDITIQSPDGKVLNEGRSSDVYVPRRIIGRGQSLQRFRVSFPQIPPQGSLVRLVSHSGPHNNST